MSWLTDTIAGRTILVLAFGLGTILGLAHVLYQTGVEREVTARNVASVAERLLVMADTILTVDPEKRDDAAHRMSGGPLELHWSRTPLAIQGGDLDPIAVALREMLLERVPELGAKGMIIGSTRIEATAPSLGRAVDEAHTTLVSLPLQDGSWLNLTLARVQSTRATAPNALLTAALGALGVVVVSVLMGRWLTRPLDRLAHGARGLFLTSEAIALPEKGTREVRTLAVAINELQQRIRRLVDDRTQMLAAVSHDLRTPLTRLRLRIRSLGDREVHRSIEADLDEMEAMIDATLAFLRDETSSEPFEPIDVAAILQSIVDDAADAGHHLDADIASNLVVTGRHIPLKRAFSNVLHNAIKYGHVVCLLARIEGKDIIITLKDEGPGIPADKLDTVFEPFYRLEPSRGRGTGGYGLGLTVARAVVRTHGGDIRLSNRTPHGLEARITLPLAQPLPREADRRA